MRSDVKYDNRPFEEYKCLFEKMDRNRKLYEKGLIREKDFISNDISDEELFLKEMKDVVPCKGKKKISRSYSGIKIFQDDKLVPDESMIIERALSNLVKYGKGFDISKTPEYDESTGAGVPSRIAEKLHSGDFSIQAYIDLHGFSSEEAEIEINRFLKESFALNRNAVLIVHGRGLSSPGEPVIKNKVKKILASNYWRRRIYACASAEKTDGGTGGTYVLLRNRALSKREEKSLFEKNGQVLKCL
ncbi:MAG: hypothetical protein CSB21_03555 [Deltaproteobacteria bacterium]|nr:MAG: hypothetical protein CSB21_03555 [Deltaproteobacteria bacterium]